MICVVQQISLKKMLWTKFFNSTADKVKSSTCTLKNVKEGFYNFDGP